MKRLLLFLPFVSALFPGAAAQLHHQEFICYSAAVQDSFTIRCSWWGNQSAPCQTVYYLDAGVRLGQEMDHIMALRNGSSAYKNVLFVGVAHSDKSERRRVRDFVPPLLQPSFRSVALIKGHADRFYSFLKDELVPLIEQHFPTCSGGTRSLIGHSHSGQFVLYCLFRGEHIFQHYYALSPALWPGLYNPLRYEKKAVGGSRATLYLSAGSREWINIRPGLAVLQKRLRQANWSGVSVIARLHKGCGHRSNIRPSLEEVFR